MGDSDLQKKTVSLNGLHKMSCSIIYILIYYSIKIIKKENFPSTYYTSSFPLLSIHYTLRTHVKQKNSSIIIHCLKSLIPLVQLQQINQNIYDPIIPKHTCIFQLLASLMAFVLHRNLIQFNKL